MTFVEINTSRTISYQQGEPVGIREFYGYPYNTEKEVFNAMGLFPLPRKWDLWPSIDIFDPNVILRLVDYEIVRDPDVKGGWRIKCVYRETTLTSATQQRLPADDGFADVRLNVETRFEDTWRQFASQNIIDEAVARICDSALVPKYAPGTPESDIGGVKVDVAGTPTFISRPLQKVTIDITTTIRPSLRELEAYLGSRNLTAFFGIPKNHGVFVGFDQSRASLGKYRLTMQIDVDRYYHLRQVVARNAAGYPILDQGGDTNALSTGQAKIVSWVQPFRDTLEWRRLHPALDGAPID